MEKVAIVILNWNGAEMLKRFLPNVLEYSRKDATVYVADNASTDDSLEILKQRFPEVRLVLLEKNWGFAEGYNKALEQIEAEYYVLLNSDVEVAHHWLAPLVEFMDNHPEAAACQPKLLSEKDHDSFEYAGASGGYLDRYGYPFCRGRIFDTVEADNGQYDYDAEVLWATGACMMIRSSDFNVLPITPNSKYSRIALYTPGSTRDSKSCGQVIIILLPSFSHQTAIVFSPFSVCVLNIHKAHKYVFSSEK